MVRHTSCCACAVPRRNVLWAKLCRPLPRPAALGNTASQASYHPHSHSAQAYVPTLTSRPSAAASASSSSMVASLSASSPSPGRYSSAGLASAVEQGELTCRHMAPARRSRRRRARRQAPTICSQCPFCCSLLGYAGMEQEPHST